jgi:phospholipid/cholesterol/gamma-HCH transport system permease protein
LEEIAVQTFTQRTMNRFRSIIESIGSTVILLLKSLRFLPSLGRQLQLHRLIDQCLTMGYATAPLVVILSFSIGAVLALQVGFSFQDFNMQEYLGSVVGLAMVRELGPVMTAIMVIGRVGSAITAELASMRIYKEIDALNTMNIPPERILVLPRLVAITIVMPILTTLSFVSGWLGGAVVGEKASFIGLDYRVYFRVLNQYVDIDAMMDGLIKAESFGICIVLICCNIGLNTRGGPREIGNSVTKAVVASIIFTLSFDYFITQILL